MYEKSWEIKSKWIQFMCESDDHWYQVACAWTSFISCVKILTIMRKMYEWWFWWVLVLGWCSLLFLCPHCWLLMKRISIKVSVLLLMSLLWAQFLLLVFPFESLSVACCKPAERASMPLLRLNVNGENPMNEFPACRMEFHRHSQAMSSFSRS